MTATVTYRNAPLVELIVQVQWPVPDAFGAQEGVAVVTGHSSGFDRWFLRLSERLADLGFGELHRQLPHDAPPLVGQPVYRFRQGDRRFPVVQFGHGVFTVNAGPPDYVCWNDFRPQVGRALEALLGSRPEELDLTELTGASLRYIDRFGEQLRAGMTNLTFIREGLGIDIPVPGPLGEASTDAASIQPALSLRIPTKDVEDGLLLFQVAAGRLGDRQEVDTIVDLTYMVSGPLPLKAEAVLGALDGGQRVLHDTFEHLVKRIRRRLQPQEEGS